MVVKTDTINKILGAIVTALIAIIIFQEIMIAIKKNNRFFWAVDVVTEADNLIQLDFCQRYNILHGRNQIIRHTWSDSIANLILPDESEAFPDLFLIRWFSYNENKFYEIDIPLPTELLNKQAKEYRNSEKEKNKALDDYMLNMVVEVKYGGALSIWLTDGNQNGERVEVCKVQAKEAEMEWNTFQSEFDRNDWVRIVQQQYNWTVVPKFMGTWKNAKIVYLSINTYPNIEYTFINVSDTSRVSTKLNTGPSKHIPQSIYLEWLDSQERTYSVDIELDNKEIIDAFAELYQWGDSLHKSELVISIIENEVHVVLQDKQKQIYMQYLGNKVLEQPSRRNSLIQII